MSLSLLLAIKTNGQKVKPLKPRGVKYLKTINIMSGKVANFTLMNEKIDPNNLIEGEDYYLTPEGYRCFTEKYHLKRGYCCKSGCRHCPYGFDKKTGDIKKK
ncbi:MAG: hypothetical protein JNL98_41750 [Bryobacterales bacterium]|nr:hypothetical protein [Bryobacterales bacterium]